MVELRRIKRKSVIYGFIASLLLLILYFTIVSLFQGIFYAVERFIELWYFMVPLIVGFGFQIGLFTYIRNFMMVTSASAGVSGGVSAVSMVACCAHHITDVIPVIGVSAVGILLLEYQSVFLAVGVVSNIIGVMLMLNIAKRSRVKFRNHVLRSMMKYDFAGLLKTSIIIMVVGLIIVSIFLGYQWYQKYYGKGYSSAVSSELNDKCATPSGYTDESWREHMGHHPDRYKECLGG